MDSAYQEHTVGEGKVTLIVGSGKSYADLAARFVKNEADIESLLGKPYDIELVKRIVRSNHRAALEFDYWLFGIEGYSRVTEVQLVRKRHASYLIKSGRCELRGKRAFSVVLPPGLANLRFPISLPGKYNCHLSGSDICNILKQWYDRGVESGIAEENLRYLKPQATEFKALIGMNTHALLDWFQLRCCRNAAFEIRDLANKMLDKCREFMPEVFNSAGASCKILGYCPEDTLQNRACIGLVPTKTQALDILKGYYE